MPFTVTMSSKPASFPQSNFHGYRAVAKGPGSKTQTSKCRCSRLGEIQEARSKVSTCRRYSSPRNGHVLVNCPPVERWVALESPTSPALPGGLLVASCLHTLPSKRQHQLPVVLRNETQTNITIHPRTIIAEMRAVQEVMESGQTNSSVVNEKLPARSNLKFDFEDSLLTLEWKKTDYRSTE